MKSKRLQELYERKLSDPEDSKKELPLEHILKKELLYYPQKPKSFDFDCLEIGPGRGDFTLKWASENPNQKMLAVEIGKKRYDKLATRIEKQALTNLTLICGDARVPLHKSLKDNSLQSCFVLFPDPWPKNKHSYKRLLQKDILELIFQKLKPSGQFTLATDVEDYARWVLKSLEDLPQAHNAFGKDTIARELPDIPPTFFSQKWQALGRDFWYVRFQKTMTSLS